MANDKKGSYILKTEKTLADLCRHVCSFLFSEINCRGLLQCPQYWKESKNEWNCSFIPRIYLTDPV